MLDGEAHVDVRIAPRRPDVIDEVFDGEAVLVNLRTGRYFALDRNATAVWTTLVPGVTHAGLVTALAAAHGTTPELVAAAAGPFLARLVLEELIVLDGDLPRPAAPAPGDAGAFAPPALEAFADMQDLLLLDPIHDIDLDDTGWPRAPAAATP
jgi:Coenzyme PQQ synthesis protein D (PqqD)